ncbi:MAG: alpha/beta fold hydrolase [Burkholderiales bacterium]
MRRLVPGLALAAFLPLSAFAAAPDRWSVATYALEIAGDVQQVDVYRPAGEAYAGVAVVAHGFTRSRARHRDLGRALAAAGVVAVVPDLPSVVNTWSNGDALARFVESLEDGAVPTLPVRREQVVLIGTSAGGLATLLAATRLPGVAGWIGLDPVDRTGTGARAATKLDAPAVVLLAEPSFCNLMASGRAIAEALPRRWRTVEVTDASHCDFEDPTNNFCEAMCGRSSDAAREEIRSEVVVTTRELLEAAR